jgi:hypothetical protein
MEEGIPPCFIDKENEAQKVTGPSSQVKTQMGDQCKTLASQSNIFFQIMSLHIIAYTALNQLHFPNELVKIASGNSMIHKYA